MNEYFKWDDIKEPIFGHPYASHNAINYLIDKETNYSKARVEITDIFFESLKEDRKLIENEYKKQLMYELGFKAAEKVYIKEIFPKPEWSRIFEGRLYTYTREELFKLLMQAFKAGVVA